jgi:hypothetical protein
LKPTFFDFHLFPVPESVLPKNTVKGAGEEEVWIWYEAGKAEQSEMESFLTNVFGAAKIDLAQHTRYTCLTKDESISFSQIKGADSARFVFLFGVDAKRIGLHFDLQPYHPVKFGEATYVLADPITEIFEERQAGKKEKSGRLWHALKSCFNT